MQPIFSALESRLFMSILSAAPSSQSELSLKEMAKRRIIDDMIEIVKLKTSAAAASVSDIENGPPDNEDARHPSIDGAGKSYIALIVDTHTLRIVSGACRQYDLQERGVTVVEQIEKPRQPLSDMDGVYFITPTESSVEFLLKDHKSSSSLYRYSHVFFSGPVPEKIFDALAKEEFFVNKCYSLYELNVDYVSFEPRVFHCDKPLTIRYLRGNDPNVMTTIIRRHIDCLTSVCASLRERPVIRYMSRSVVSNLAEKIALGFKREVDALASAMDRMHKPFKSSGTTFLILDRSIESGGLFAHEFSYQALALDILDGMEPSGIRWSLGASTNDSSLTGGMSVIPSFDFKSVNGKGEEEEKHAVLGDHDDLWTKFRHLHVKDVSETTTKEIREFSKSHNLAKLQKDGNARRASDADPMDLLRSLPEYQDVLAKYSVHIEMSKQCFDLVDKLKLMEIARIEQELVTGVDDDGKEVSCIKIFQALTTLLQSGRIGPEEKLRLVAMYLSQVNDVNESSAQTLVRTAANLSPEYEAVVKQFLALGIHGTRLATGPGVSSSAAASTRHTHKYANEKNVLKKNKSRAKSSVYINCRFVPRLKDIVESTLQNSLDVQEFPPVSGSGTSTYNVAGSSGVHKQNDSEESSSATTSKRSAASLWGEMESGEGASRNSAMRQKIVVFVIGGITLAETRAMAELEKQYNCDVIIGGSTLLTPKRLVEVLLAPSN